MAIKSEINKKDLINLQEISNEEFSRITDNLYSQLINYKLLPNLVLLPNVNSVLREKLGITGKLYITKNRLLHTNPVRKNAHKEQGFSKDEYKSIPDIIRNATYALKESESSYNSFLLTFLDKNNAEKVNCIIFDEDKNGNLLTTIKKIPLLSLRNRIYEIVGAGVEPAISNALREPSTTLTTSPNDSNLITKEDFVNTHDNEINQRDVALIDKAYKLTRSEYLENKTELSDEDIVRILDLPAEKEIRTQIKSYTDKDYLELAKDNTKLSQLTESLKNDAEYLTYRGSYIAKSKLLYESPVTLCNEIPSLLIGEEIGESFYLLPYGYAKDKSENFKKFADMLERDNFIDIKRNYSTKLKHNFKKGHNQGNNIFFFITSDKTDYEKIRQEINKCVYNRKEVQNKTAKYIVYIEQSNRCGSFSFDTTGKLVTEKEYTLKQIRSFDNERPLVARGRMQSIPSGTSLILNNNDENVNDLFHSLLLRGELEMIRVHPELHIYSDKYKEACSTLGKITNETHSKLLKSSNLAFLQSEKQTQFYKDLQKGEEKTMENTNEEIINQETENSIKKEAKAIIFTPENADEFAKMANEGNIPLKADEAKKLIETFQKAGLTLRYEPLPDALVINGKKEALNALNYEENMIINIPEVLKLAGIKVEENSQTPDKRVEFSAEEEKEYQEWEKMLDDEQKAEEIIEKNQRKEPEEQKNNAILDQEIEQIQANGGMSEAAMEADIDSESLDSFFYDETEDNNDSPSENEIEAAERAYQEWEEMLDDNQSEENDNNGQLSKFDSELSEYIAGKLPKNHIFNLGFPGKILQNCGFPKDQRIELSGSHLEFKSKLKRHPFDLGEIKGLDVALQNPLAVFAYGDKTKSQNIIVNIEKEGKNFLTGIHFNQKNRGYEVSDIRTLYPKENIEWLNWINQGKLIYGNKEKLQALIAQQRMNVAEVNSQVVQSPLHEHCLESVENILQKFGDVKEIYTDGYLFYEEIREQSKIEQKFFAYYTEKGNLDARELSTVEADEFYTALKNNDIAKIDEYKKNDLHEISELANEIFLDYTKNNPKIVNKIKKPEQLIYTSTEIGHMEKENANSFTKEATDTIQTVIARNSYALEHSSIREQVGAVIDSIPLANEKSTIINNNEKSQENHSNAKEYMIQTTRLFLSMLKEKELPFLKGKEQGSIIIINPQAVRDAATGKAFTGYTQLMAQALIQALYDQKKLPELEYDLITYDQAKACGTFIKKGSPHITLTNYNRTTNSASKQMYYFKSGCNSPEMIDLHKESIARNRAIKRIRLSLEEKEIPSERQTEEKNKITLLHYEELTYLKSLKKDTEQYINSLPAEEKNMLTELCKKTPLTQKTVKELAETLRKDRLISTQLSLQKNSERYFDATECIVPEDFIAKAMAAASLGCSLETTEKTIDSITKNLHQTLSKNIDHYDYGKAFEVGEVINEKCIKNCKDMKNQEYEAAELAKKLEQKQQELKKNPINLLMELLNKNDLSNRTIGGYER